MCSLILDSLPSFPQILHLLKEQLDIDDNKSNSDNNDWLVKMMKSRTSYGTELSLFEEQLDVHDDKSDKMMIMMKAPTS